MNAMACTHRYVTLVEFDDRFAFSCHRCHEMGYGTCYHCANGCDYQVHKECLTASSEAYYSFFGHRPFILQRQPSPLNTGNLCTACGITVKGLMYACTLESGITIYLHPCCMKLPHCLETNDCEKEFSLKKKLLYLKCQYCERTKLEGLIDGWAYVSADQKSACHVKCMKDRLYEDWIMYAHLEEQQGVNNGPWWLRTYEDSLVPWVGSSSSSPISPAGLSLSSSSPTSSAGSNSSSSSPTSSAGSNLSSPTSPAGSSQGQQNSVAMTTTSSPTSLAGSSQGQQNSVAMTTTKTKGKKRRVFWKLTKLAIELFIAFTGGGPINAVVAVHDLF